MPDTVSWDFWGRIASFVPPSGGGLDMRLEEKQSKKKKMAQHSTRPFLSGVGGWFIRLMISLMAGLLQDDME